MTDTAAGDPVITGCVRTAPKIVGFEKKCLQFIRQVL